MPAKKPPVAVTPSQAQRKGTRHAPARYNQDEGRKALTALADVLAPIQEKDLVTVRVDVETAMLACLAVAGFVQSPEVHVRFARLPREEFDMAALDGLAEACSATMFALVEAKRSGSLESDAKIPVEIANEATEVEARMQSLCEYHLSDDREIRPLLDLLRPGNGHRDLAHDLNGYADIYEARHAVVSTDTKHYRPGDSARAKELATLLFEAISGSMSRKARDAYATYVRAWTLACQRYEEVRSAGLWLFRADLAPDELFPSLFAVGRPSVGRPRKQPAAEPPAAPPAEAVQPDR